MLKRMCLLFLSLMLLLPAPCALADNGYSITNYSMYIDVLSDGSAAVTETLVYSFDGEYNGVLSLFDTDGIDGVADFTVSIDGQKMILVDTMNYIDGTYTITEDGNLAEVRIYSPGASDTRAVTYEYTMLSLADRYEDTGMILRSFIGENSSVTLQNATVTVHFPGNEGILAFVHGAMSASDITARDDGVVFGPANISPGKSVEMRLLFPAEWISDAPLIEESMLEAALSEEQRLAEEAALRAVRIENAKYIFAAAYILIFFAVWLLLVRKYGLKGRLPETPNLRRLTAYPAAFATAALEDEPDTDALSGTLMELVLERRVNMETEGADVRFSLLNADVDGLYPHQAQLLQWLFDGQDSLLLSDLNAGQDYQRAQRFEQGYARYCSQVTGDMLARDLMYRNDGLRIFINALIVILGAMGAGGILIAGTPNILLGLVVAGMLFLLLFLMSRVRRLTDEGERLQMDAEAFRVNGFAEDENCAGYIAYYAALGMTEPLIRAMESGREDSNGGAFHEDMPPYLYAGWYYSLHTLTASLRDTHHHNASIPDPNASSSSGSSGGGSNGGGGGHGAW